MPGDRRVLVKPEAPLSRRYAALAREGRPATVEGSVPSGMVFVRFDNRHSYHGPTIAVPVAPEYLVELTDGA